MTDARLPERWLNDRRLQRLSADHFRTFVNALMYAVTNRSDGRIEAGDLGVIPHWAPGAAQAFIDAGLFAAQDDGWLITDYEATQTSRGELEMLEKIRARDRLRKAEKRAEDKASSANVAKDSPGDVPPDVSRGQSRGIAQAGRQAGRQDSLKGADTQLCDNCKEHPRVPGSWLCGSCSTDRKAAVDGKL